MVTSRLYYSLKPYIRRSVQIRIRKFLVSRKIRKVQKLWPIDPSAAALPPKWPGWPSGKQFALLLSHDVDTEAGYQKCERLMDVEIDLGFRSAFYFVPQKYSVSENFRQRLTQLGFEVGVHGLKHDGKLYKSKRTFDERAQKINEYLRNWNSVGFRSPAMHHNLDWIHGLSIEYDASTFDTDPFEPQPDGVGTIFPFRVPNQNGNDGYIEIPYTLPQDFTVFVLLGEKSPAIWKRKLDWIAEKGGMAFFITHPDYMAFGGGDRSIDQYPVTYYTDFLKYIQTEYKGRYWHPLPQELAEFWKARTIK